MLHRGLGVGGWGFSVRSLGLRSTVQGIGFGVYGLGLGVRAEVVGLGWRALAAGLVISQVCLSKSACHSLQSWV